MIYLLIAALVLGAGLLVYMWKMAFANNVLVQELDYDDFPEGFSSLSVFFISDIHRRVVTPEIISKVKGKADIVVIGGDLTEKGVPFSDTAKNLELLASIGPCYFVWGNNDYETDYHQLDSLLLDKKIKILDNTAVTFESSEGNGKIALIGVDEISGNRDRLDLAIGDAPSDGFRILVCHNPRITRKVKNEYHIKLILSGHTHGGQIRIFGWGLKEKGKLERTGKYDLLISNGYGTRKLPLRLGAPSETHLLILKPKKAH